MNQGVIKRILEKYKLEWSEILTQQKGYRNLSNPVLLKNGEIINIILHKAEPGALSLINMANEVSGFAGGGGLPTRQLASDRIIKLSAPEYEQYAAVYTYLPGSTIPWEAYTQTHIKLLGKGLSNLHARLKSLPNAKELPYAANEYYVLTEQMKDYFSDEGVRRAMQTKLRLRINPAIFNRLTKLLKLSSTLPDQQALHMDFVRGNILYEKDNGALRISGILDFEKTAYGPPVFDIARTLAFLLVDCKYKHEDKVRKYFLASGYNKRGSSEFNETRLLEEMLSLFMLHDFYKFLKHNPYEFLEQNEHFVRTRRHLLSRDIVDRIGTR